MEIVNRITGHFWICHREKNQINILQKLTIVSLPLDDEKKIDHNIDELIERAFDMINPHLPQFLKQNNISLFIPYRNKLTYEINNMELSIVYYHNYDLHQEIFENSSGYIPYSAINDDKILFDCFRIYALTPEECYPSD
jgi:hypothetical protein